MSTLVLELRQGDLMVVNGAPIRFRNRTRIELAARARFLFGKQIMAPDAADTPARRIYFALQTAYIGTDEERAGGLESARALINEFQDATTSDQARSLLAEALDLAERDECYAALKLARRIMRHEEEVLGLPAHPLTRVEAPRPPAAAPIVEHRRSGAAAGAPAGTPVAGRRSEGTLVGVVARER